MSWFYHEIDNINASQAQQWLKWADICFLFRLSIFGFLLKLRNIYCRYSENVSILV